MHRVAETREGQARREGRCVVSERIKIVLVDRERRYRKVTRKGGIHNRRWRSLMVPVKCFILMGAEAAKRFGAKHPRESYADVLEFTPKLWAWVQRRRPEFAAKCDVFRRVEKQDPVFGTVTGEERCEGNIS